MPFLSLLFILLAAIVLLCDRTGLRPAGSILPGGARLRLCSGRRSTGSTLRDRPGLLLWSRLRPAGSTMSGRPVLRLHCGQPVRAAPQRLLGPERYEGRLAKRPPPDLILAALPDVQHDSGRGDVLRIEKFLKLFYNTNVLVVQAFLDSFPDSLFYIRRFDVCDNDSTCKLIFDNTHVCKVQ